VPQRRPVTTLVGAPIPIQKVPEPTEEQINKLHEKFAEELTALFETKKSLYLPILNQSISLSHECSELSVKGKGAAVHS